MSSVARERRPVPGRHRRGLLDGRRRRGRDRLVRRAARAARSRPRSTRDRAAHRGRLPQPGRRCPTAACWSSAPRRPASSSPTSSPAPAAGWCSRWGRTPGCPGATAAWTSCGGSTPWASSTGASTSIPTPAAARAEPSLQLVGRHDGPRRRPALPAGPRASASPAGSPASTGGRVRFADDLRTTTGRADARLRRLLRPHRRGTPPPPGCWARSTRPRRCAPCGPTVRGVRGSTCATRGSAACSGRPDTGGPTRGCTCRCSTGAGEIRHVDGRTPAPGLHVVGTRWQSRRSSSFLDGVRHDAATVVGRRPATTSAPARCGRAA